MRKLLAFLFLLTVFAPAGAAKTSSKLPDNIYFRAMQDEMARTLKELRSSGAPNPYYVAYKLLQTYSFNREASFGQLYPAGNIPEKNLEVLVVLGAGSEKSDQLGFENNNYYYSPTQAHFISLSYDGLRRALWRATDSEYLVSVDSYVKKQAYKRKKALSDALPDVTPAPQAAVFEAIDTFIVPDAAKWEALVKRLSAKGKEVPALENFIVTFMGTRRETYYLNSYGGAYQVPLTRASVKLTAKLRNKDGHIQTFKELIPLENYLAPDEKALEEKTDAFLVEMAERYNAYKAESYLGPVLLRPNAAADFVGRDFVWQVENVKPLLSDLYEQDSSAGGFREKKGMRVLANTFDISDKPLLREYKGLPLVLYAGRR